MEAVVHRCEDRSILAYPQNCTGCLICELRCSLRLAKEFDAARSAIRVRRLIGGGAEFDLAFSDVCDGCGLCARFCPYGALAFQKGSSHP
jgi:NAD-dependent dihydropyrimidine dehydrogenase PreA subunit